MDRRAIYITAVFALLIVGMLATLIPRGSPSGTAPVAGRFPGAWSTAPDSAISAVIVGNGITGCGEYRHKQDGARSGEYLVQCSRDGSNWRSYLVWPAIGKATGPVDENDLP